jgi:16S rRNA (guanine527-N7)-methyltransferase
MIDWIPVTEVHRTRIAKAEEEHRSQLGQFGAELLQFNKRHNLISSSAEDHIFEHHIRHCLAINCLDFPNQSSVVDWGSGGGLPAIPLAITQSSIKITSVDKVGKKTQAVAAMARRLSIPNIDVYHGRAEAWPSIATHSVSRATATLATLWDWHTRMRSNADDSFDSPLAISTAGHTWPEGLICLKGGALEWELGHLQAQYPSVSISGWKVDELLGDLLDTTYFESKYLLLIKKADTHG